MGQEVTIAAIPIQMLETVKDEAMQMIGKAIHKGADDTLDSVWDDLTNGRSLLLMVARNTRKLAALVVDIVEVAGVKRMVIKLCGGIDMSIWVDDVYESLVLLARDIQAKSIRIYGRKGWAKLPGYREIFRAYELEV